MDFDNFGKLLILMKISIFDSKNKLLILLMEFLVKLVKLVLLGLAKLSN